MKKLNFSLLLLQTLLMPLQLCLLIVLEAGKVPIAICAFLLMLHLCIWAGSVLEFRKKGGIACRSSVGKVEGINLVYVSQIRDAIGYIMKK